MTGIPPTALLGPLSFVLLGTGAGPAPTAGDEPSCSWCLDDPENLAAIGAVSHGPFPFAKADTEAVAEFPSGHGWVFLETEHLRFASSLGPQAVKAKDRERLEAELDRLRAGMPELPAKIRKLDPFLRLHLMALRCEDFYDRFQQLLGVTDEDFPERRTAEGPYMGNGRFLGEADKFEIFFHVNRTTHQLFTRDNMGVQVTDALRWHFSPQHKHLASIPAEDSDLRFDAWLFPHTVHQLAHMCFAAYKHYSYDPPVWLDEGLAHVMEREVEGVSTTLCGDEGSGPHRGGHQDWEGKDARLARRGKATSLAQLMHLATYGDMDVDTHITAWSKVRFLVEAHPEGFARFVGGIKGQLDEAGYPTGKDLPGLQRRLLKEIWGWTPPEFDEAWKAWVLEQ